MGRPTRCKGEGSLVVPLWGVLVRAFPEGAQLSAGLGWVFSAWKGFVPFVGLDHPAGCFGLPWGFPLGAGGGVGSLLSASVHFGAGGWGRDRLVPLEPVLGFFVV